MQNRKAAGQAVATATFVCDGRPPRPSAVRRNDLARISLVRAVTESASIKGEAPTIAPEAPAPDRWSKTTRRLARRLKLSLVTLDDLSRSRRRHGKAFRYFNGDGAPLRSRPALKRLNSLAVPPA